LVFATYRDSGGGFVFLYKLAKVEAPNAAIHYPLHISGFAYRHTNL
jgi:hypothetical protein